METKNKGNNTEGPKLKVVIHPSDNDMRFKQLILQAKIPLHEKIKKIANQSDKE